MNVDEGVDVCCGGIWPGGEGEWWSRSHGLSASPFLPSHPHDRDISFIVSIRVISCPQLIIQLSSHTVSDLVELVECKHRISLGSATIRQYAQDQTYLL